MSKLNYQYGLYIHQNLEQNALHIATACFLLADMQRSVKCILNSRMIRDGKIPACVNSCKKTCIYCLVFCVKQNFSAYCNNLKMLNNLKMYKMISSEDYHMPAEFSYVPSVGTP